MDTRHEWNDWADEDRELLAQIEEAVAAPDVSAGQPGTPRHFCAQLRGSASRVDDVFRDRLEDRLVALIRERSRTPAVAGGVNWRLRVRQWLQPRRQVRLTLGLIALLSLWAALATGATWPAIAAALPHLAPREVETLPPVRPSPVRTIGWSQMESQEEIERAVGFHLLIPTYLPSDCQELQGRFNLRMPGQPGAELHYPCVIIKEMRGRSDGEPDNPMIGPPGSVEQLTIDGEPGFYVDGTWWWDNEQNRNVWKSGLYQSLYFTHGDIFIIVTDHSNPNPAIEGHARDRASKEVMIRIAESLQ